MSSKERKPLILCIEDEDDWRQLLAMRMQSIDVQVEFVKTIEEATLFAEAHGPDSDNPIDLITLDMWVPLVKGEGPVRDAGIQFIRLYGIVPPRVPIIVFTAHEDYEQCVSAIKLGADDYILKSYPDSPPGIDGTSILIERCRSLLAEQAIIETKDPDDQWFQRHHEKIKCVYAGKYVAFVKSPLNENLKEPIERAEIDGVTILAAPTASAMRISILHSRELSRILPIVIYIENNE